MAVLSTCASPGLPEAGQRRTAQGPMGIILQVLSASLSRCLAPRAPLPLPRENSLSPFSPLFLFSPLLSKFCFLHSLAPLTLCLLKVSGDHKLATQGTGFQSGHLPTCPPTPGVTHHTLFLCRLRCSFDSLQLGSLFAAPPYLPVPSGCCS